MPRAPTRGPSYRSSYRLPHLHNLSIFYSKFVKFFNRCFHPIVTIFASASCSLIQDEAFHYERILGEEELSLTLDFWWFLFFLIVVFGWVDGVSPGSSKLLMLFPSACLTKHRNPSSAFKFAGFCDVAQFLGWILVCNLNLPFASGDYWGEGRVGGSWRICFREQNVYEDLQIEMMMKMVMMRKMGECSQEESVLAANEGLHLPWADAIQCLQCNTMPTMQYRQHIRGNTLAPGVPTCILNAYNTL